jgi:FtsP/CotA-like multicopper oxidase with cupredoxin domain
MVLVEEWLGHSGCAAMTNNRRWVPRTDPADRLRTGGATCSGVTCVALVLGSFACGPNEQNPADGTEPALVAATDENPDPRVVEVSLEARPGTKLYADSPETAVWTYNGSVPGPLISGRVGDELLVHFTNELPEETTIHWHGLRLPASMDGTLAMQSPVPPGGTFEYRYELKDAGLFWFHPHVRSDVQVEKGLHGVIRVISSATPKRAPACQLKSERPAEPSTSAARALIAT